MKGGVARGDKKQNEIIGGRNTSPSPFQEDIQGVNQLELELLSQQLYRTSVILSGREKDGLQVAGSQIEERIKNCGVQMQLMTSMSSGSHQS